MSLKILAIDDSRTIREMLRKALGSAGFEVHLADDDLAC
jgi:two-component system, chemotaxis family, chemotaxis protein CheY